MVLKKKENQAMFIGSWLAILFLLMCPPAAPLAIILILLIYSFSLSLLDDEPEERRKTGNTDEERPGQELETGFGVDLTTSQMAWLIGAVFAGMIPVTVIFASCFVGGVLLFLNLNQGGRLGR